MPSRLKEKIQNAILSFHSRDLETGGWVHRVGRPVVILYLADVTMFYMVTQFELVQLEQIPIFTLCYFLIQLVLGFTLIMLVFRLYVKPATAAP